MRCVFADCEPNTETHEFVRAGRPVHAEPQVLSVLEYLITHRDRVVPKVDA